jgi:secreted PhoX family phosphatase
MLSRRQFTKGACSLAFAGLSLSALGKNTVSLSSSIGYGPLKADPKGLLDLPNHFSYSIISSFNHKMSDGLHVPNRADGMGCFDLGNNKVALVRNHELRPKDMTTQPESLKQFMSEKAYDSFSDNVALPGGTSTLVYDMTSKQVTEEFMSLIGTVRNCSGGVTPWNTWLSCEESVDVPNGEIKQAHGYVFEVPAAAARLVDAKPIKAMGRFNHEAAAVDPKTGIVYMTEDRDDSLFYRYVPNEYGNLQAGGILQALVIKDQPEFDSRNWHKTSFALNQWLDAKWVTLDNPESPNDDLRQRGRAKGATLFARGEGVHWANDELYFCCTSGGNKRLGQIMRYSPSSITESTLAQQTGKLQLFLESTDESLYNFGDNLTVTPQGHLLVCEDQYTKVVDNHLRGVTNEGKVYSFARLHAQTELAGACFSPDGSTLFVNVYSPTKTLAITGPWETVV